MQTRSRPDGVAEAVRGSFQGVGHRGNRVVFNIAGNAYRLIVSFNYGFQAGYIKFFGTHAEYERVDAKTVDYTGATWQSKALRSS